MKGCDIDLVGSAKKYKLVHVAEGFRFQ